MEKVSKKNIKPSKSKKKLNIIDIIIIILVVALIATAGYRIYTEITESIIVRQSNNILTFECNVEYINILKYLNGGDAVYLASDGTLLGYLFDNESDDDRGAVYEVKDEAGNNLNASGQQNQSKIKLKGSIKLDADALKTKNGGYYVINGRNISVGSSIDVYTENAIFTIVVKEISDSH